MLTLIKFLKASDVSNPKQVSKHNFGEICQIQSSNATKTIEFYFCKPSYRRQTR